MKKLTHKDKVLEDISYPKRKISTDQDFLQIFRIN